MLQVLGTPKFKLLAMLLKKPLLLFATIPIAVVTPEIDLQSVVKVLFYLFVLDFITGLCASYFDWKKDETKKDKWFFGKGEGFSSDKFKKMFVKLIVYAGGPLIINEFQKVFFIKSFRYEIISEASIDIATFLVFLFCLNEGYSIFHENLPKCGFNIFSLAKKLIGIYKETKNDLKE